MFSLYLSWGFSVLFNAFMNRIMQCDRTATEDDIQKIEGNVPNFDSYIFMSSAVKLSLVRWAIIAVDDRRIMPTTVP